MQLVRTCANRIVLTQKAVTRVRVKMVTLKWVISAKVSFSVIEKVSLKVTKVIGKIFSSGLFVFAIFLGWFEDLAGSSVQFTVKASSNLCFFKAIR